MVKELISIIVPIYNNHKSLDSCLESLLKQSYKKIEILLVDDGSTDGSSEICDKYAKSYKRIRVFHKKNGGVSSARNFGIKNAKGEFIFFVDADDSIVNDALEKLINIFIEKNVDLAVGDFLTKGKENNLFENKFLYSDSKFMDKDKIIYEVINYLKRPTGFSIFNYVWGKLYKTAVIKENNLFFDENLSVYEDVKFIFEYLENINSLFYMRNHIYNYSITNNLNLSKNKNYKNPTSYKFALNAIEKFLLKNNVNSFEIKKYIGNAYIYFTIRTMISFFSNKIDVNIYNLYKLISKIVNDFEVRSYLKYYSPSNGDSRIIPIMIKFKFILGIILVCKYKAFIKIKHK